MAEAQAAECRGGPGHVGLDGGTYFPQHSKLWASSAPPERHLTCQAQSGSLARDWRVGRQAGNRASSEGSHMVGVTGLSRNGEGREIFQA